MKVRVAGLEDIPSIRALELEAFDFTWEADVFEKELRRTDCLFTVGQLDETTVALASLNWVVDEVHLMSIAVTDGFRGQGLARQLLGENLAFCRGLNLQWMTLEVKWDNPPALALYKSYGFTTAGRRKNYYRDGQDARIMWSERLSEERYQTSLEKYQDAGERILRQWRQTRP